MAILQHSGTEDDEIIRDFRKLAHLYIKAKVLIYFKDKPAYLFDITKGSKRYSLDAWLNGLFDKLALNMAMSRTEFINFIANDLLQYSAATREHLSKYKVFVITGYIASFYTLCYSEEQYAEFSMMPPIVRADNRLI